jgi:hypothetical protein
MATPMANGCFERKKVVENYKSYTPESLCAGTLFKSLLKTHLFFECYGNINDVKRP